MSVGKAIRAGAERLAQTSDTARLDAELLMAHALGTSRSDMLLRHMQDAEPAGYTTLIERRATHEPVAHIIGLQEFYGRNFRVTKDTLIPRGDSEILLDTALELKPDAQRVLDLGTGTGALLLSVLAETDARGTALDRSPAAVEIARENARMLGVESRAEISVGDWNAPGWAEALGQFDVILCNPPYIESDAALDADVRDFEPAGALFAGKDGLDDYRTLIPQLTRLMADNALAILEIGHTQAESVGAIAEKAGFAVTLRRDLANRPRALVLRLGVGKPSASR